MPVAAPAIRRHGLHSHAARGPPEAPRACAGRAPRPGRGAPFHASSRPPCCQQRGRVLDQRRERGHRAGQRRRRSPPAPLTRAAPRPARAARRTLASSRRSHDARQELALALRRLDQVDRDGRAGDGQRDARQPGAAADVGHQRRALPRRAPRRASEGAARLSARWTSTASAGSRTAVGACGSSASSGEEPPAAARAWRSVQADARPRRPRGGRSPETSAPRFTFYAERSARTAAA